MEKPDTITITVTSRNQVVANAVDVYVVTKGPMLVTGSDALKRAKEISQQFTALRDIGLKEDDVTLLGIFAEGAGGFIGPSTSATYQLCIRCNDLALLPNVLAVVTAQRHARLESLSWRCSSEKEARLDCLQAGLTEAKEQAERIASGLGVKLLGVHALAEKWQEVLLEDKPHVAEDRALTAFTKEQLPFLGMPLTHTRRIELRLDVEFRIGGFEAAR